MLGGSAFVATIAILGFSFGNSNQEQILWGANWLKLMLQDLFLSPIVGVLGNFLIMKLISDHKSASERIKKVLKMLADHDISLCLNVLSGKRDDSLTRELGVYNIKVNFS